MKNKWLYLFQGINSGTKFSNTEGQRILWRLYREPDRSKNVMVEQILVGKELKSSQTTISAISFVCLSNHGSHSWFAQQLGSNIDGIVRITQAWLASLVLIYYFVFTAHIIIFGRLFGLIKCINSTQAYDKE
jgi:hypothetical protein